MPDRCDGPEPDRGTPGTLSYYGRCEVHGDWQSRRPDCPRCESVETVRVRTNTDAPMFSPSPESFTVAHAGSAEPTNPKDRVGVGKAPLSFVPLPVLSEVGLAMMEGALKYGEHNWREAGVRGSVYFDAAWRHLSAWWEGEEIDPDSGLSHITKAIAGLCVLRDAMLQQKFEDDRPPMSPPGWQQLHNKKAAEIRRKHGDEG